MANNATFQLDISGAGKTILQEMAADIVRSSGQAIMDRANGMASSQSKEAPGFELHSSVGVIKTGRRAIATVKAKETDSIHGAYVARLALTKAKDAGRVN